MIQYQDDNFFFSASSIVAIFPDGLERSLDNVTIKSSTPLGEEWYLTTSNTDSQSSSSSLFSSSSSSHIVRLIVIPPKHDWRRDQSYTWKLDSAWMSDSDESDVAWVHWNVNSYVNSVIQVPSVPSQLEQSATTIPPIFACAKMEFHFSPILRSSVPPTHQTSPVVAGPRVTLQNVRMGVYLNGTKSMNPPKEEALYYPCQNDQDNSCSVVDGDVVASVVAGNNTTIGTKEITKLSLIGIGGIVVLVVLFVMICAVKWCCRIHRTKRYEQIIPPNVEDDDLTLQVDDSDIDVDVDVDGRGRDVSDVSFGNRIEPLAMGKK
jgi:hypothetical protein